MALSLPNNASLERFRRDARTLQRAVRGGDAAALARVSRLLGPVDAPLEFRLATAQLAIARTFGFSSWPRLRDYFGRAESLSRDTSVVTPGTPSETFLAHACLRYDASDGPDRWAVATAILSANPALPEQDPFVAAAVADPVAVQAHLDRDPSPARSEGGPFRWTMLFYLAYSRVPQQDPIGVARILLDSGADPDAGYLWQRLPTPFTVLTGCFGEGEQGPGRQPRHPQGDELARLLLERGAVVNDGQSLYNRMFGRDDSHLRLLLEFGLGTGGFGVWEERLGGGLESVSEMMERQVDWAREHGLTGRLDLLATHGFDHGRPSDDPSPWRRRTREPDVAAAGTPDAVRALAAAGGDVNARVEGRTALHQAAWIGDVELVQALLDAGADPDAVDDTHGTTPLAWAEYAHADATAAVLRPLTRE